MGFFNSGLRAKAQNNYNLRWTLNRMGEWVYPDNKSETYINQGYKALPNVYSIISLILSKTTIVPVEVYKVKNKSKHLKYKSMLNDPRNYAKALKYKNESLEKIENHPLEELLLNPNNYQSFAELNWEIDGYKMLTGNSYLFHIAAGSTNELHNIPSPCVDINVKGSPFSPELSYKVNYLEQTLKTEDVLHFKYWNPITSDQSPSKSFKGLSPLQSCRLLLGRYKDADITQGFMFKNQGPGGLLTGESNTDLTQEQAISLQDRFKQQHTGTHKANDIIITPSKLSWTAIGLSPVDLNILQSKRDALSEVCNVYNVPIGLLSDTNSTENNMIESRKALITDAVIPIVEARKHVYNKFLAPKFGDDIVIEYDYSVFMEMQEDIQKQAQAANTMYWISLNEKRSLTGYDQDPDPNMDKKYIPSGLTSLDELNAPVDEIDEPFLEPDAEANA